MPISVNTTLKWYTLGVALVVSKVKALNGDHFEAFPIFIMSLLFKKFSFREFHHLREERGPETISCTILFHT